jgi:hypothetical protein
VERFEELEAVEPRHHQIENDDSVFAIVGEAKSGYAVVGGVYLERLSAQSGRKERPDRVVILNYQHPWWNSGHFREQYALEWRFVLGSA